MQAPKKDNEDDYLDRKPAAKLVSKAHTAGKSSDPNSRTTATFSGDASGAKIGGSVALDSVALTPSSNIDDERKVDHNSVNDQKSMNSFDKIAEATTCSAKPSTADVGRDVQEDKTLLTGRSATEVSRVENKENCSSFIKLDILAECTRVLPSKVLDEIPEDAKDQHLLKLLLLFTNDMYDKMRLDDLARKCGFPINFLEKRIDLLTSNEVDQSHSVATISDSDTSLPSRLAMLREIVPYEDFAKTKLVSEEYNDEVKPSSCIALQLHDLELSTRQWYFNTIAVGQNVNPHKGQKSTAQHGTTRSARFFSLKYNESSLSTISRWSCRNGSPEVNTPNVRSPGNRALSVTQSPERTDASAIGFSSLSPETRKSNEIRSTFDVRRPLKHPTVDKRFRKCTVCKLWGHYEIECENLTPRDLLRFAREINALKNPSISVKNSISIGTFMNEEQEPMVSTHLDSTRGGQQKQGLLKEQATNLDDAKEVSVRVEIFQGFLVEQRKEPEASNASIFQEENEINSIPVYDDSFLVDGFPIKAATSLQELENGEASSLPSASRTKARDFIRRNTPKKALESFTEGGIVAWFAEPSNTDNVFTGVVLKTPATIPNVRDSTASLICVEFLTSIPPSPDSESIAFRVGRTPDNVNDTPQSSTKQDMINNTSSSFGNTNCPQFGCGSMIWIHEKDLFLVHERWNITHPEELRGKKRKYNSRKKIESIQNDATKTTVAATSSVTGSKVYSRIKPIIKNPKLSKSRSMSYRERFKESGRVQPKDMSLAPRKPARKLADGTYSMPQGRRPVGLDWDHIRGVWSLPKKDTKSKPRR